MRQPLTKDFILAKYTVSDTAQRKGYTEQFKPPAEVIEALKYLHDNIVVHLLDSPDLPGEIFCTSGYRCSRTNKDVGGAATSQHMTGEAVDLEYYENGKERNMVLHDSFLIRGLEFDQLIREYGTKDNPAWIHISLKKSGNRKQAIVKL